MRKLKRKFYVWKWDKDSDGYNTNSGNWYEVSKIHYMEFDGVMIAVVLDYTEDNIFYVVHPNLTKIRHIKED